MKNQTKFDEGMKLVDPRDGASNASGTIDSLGTAAGIERERTREERADQIVTRPLEEPSIPTVDDLRRTLPEPDSN